MAIVIGVATTQEKMELIAPDNVIVAANIGNNIYTWRRGTATWGPVSTAVGTAYNPQIYYSPGGTVTVIWQDTRFNNPPSTYFITGCYGIFGLRLDYLNGGILAGWTANNGGAADNNGISIVLSRYSYLLPNPIIAPYNDGSNSLVIWEDYRNGRDNDLVYRNLDGFPP